MPALASRVAALMPIVQSRSLRNLVFLSIRPTAAAARPRPLVRRVALELVRSC